MKKRTLLLIMLAISIGVKAQLTLITSGTTNDINSIRIRDGQIFFLGDNYLSKTTDFGKNLIQLNPPSQLPYTYALNVVDTSNLYLISANHYSNYIYRIMHSTDGGISWNALFDTTTFIHDLTVNDNGNLLGVGTFGNLFNSADGINWTTTNVGNITTIWECESLSDSSFFIGGFEYMASSFDLGNNWNISYFNQSHCSGIIPINQDTLYMTSYFWNGWESFFSKTTDGGNTWTTNSLGYGIGIFDLDFINQTHGLAVGYDFSDSVGIILETFDTGNNWVTHYTKYNSAFLDVKVISDSLIFISGTNGIILKTDTLYSATHESTNIAPFKFIVFPNPANSSSIITIIVNEPGVYQSKLYDLQGKTLREIEFNTKVTLDNLSPGEYLIKVVDMNHKTLVKKFIIK